MRPIPLKKSFSLFVALSLCGISGYLLYSILKKDEEEDDDLSNEYPRKADFKIIKVPIPKESVGCLIGRNGSNIKSIQEESNTRISFDKKADSEIAICIIRGKLEDCKYAESVIKNVIASQPVIDSLEIFVPQAVVGRIIGRCGEQITEIITKSGAQVKISPDGRSESTRKVLIRGSKEQIALAHTLIQEIVERFSSSDAQINASLAKREPRIRSKSPNLKLPQSPHVERISPIVGQNDSPFEVYVSAMVDPSHFWLQIVGPKATELDQLVEEMTEYYNNSENRELHVVNSVECGDLVAAVFECDQKWYRAEVLSLLKEDGKETSVELYYLDYGDTDVVMSNDVYDLRTDFLRLNFQAIECYLAGIEPKDGSWSDEAKDMFEEWTHVAKWKKLSARMNGYSVREKTRAKREGSPVPGVDLFDTDADRDVNIAQELVSRGYAVFKKQTDAQSK